VGGFVKDRIELPQSVVSCTQGFTDVAPVAMFRVNDVSRAFDLIFSVYVCMREMY
jgi:hypothetical protein